MYLYLHGTVINLDAVEGFQCFSCAIDSRKDNGDSAIHDPVGSIREDHFLDRTNSIAEVILKMRITISLVDQQPQG